MVVMNPKKYKLVAKIDDVLREKKNNFHLLAKRTEG